MPTYRAASPAAPFPPPSPTAGVKFLWQFHTRGAALTSPSTERERLRDGKMTKIVRTTKIITKLMVEKYTEREKFRRN